MDNNKLFYKFYLFVFNPILKLLKVEHEKPEDKVFDLSDDAKILGTGPHAQRHPFHLVDPSPWPFFTGISVLFLTFGFVLYLHSFKNGAFLSLLGLFFLISNMFNWWRDVIREGTFEGKHTLAVQRNLRYGMLLFIASEVMFFFSIFWAFFHASLNPTMEIGFCWPPAGIQVIPTWGAPFLNTVILVNSGVSITWSHKALRTSRLYESIFALFITIAYGILFTVLQVREYIHAPFTMSDRVYGSVFYLATGFHGFHVIIGTIFLIVCFFRMGMLHFRANNHLGFVFAIWYWHFVDVVWIFLFLSVYWWGNYRP